MISDNKKAALHSKAKKIWIDLDNSPHVLFFNPIIKVLKKKGYKVVVTARDFGQVIDLTELFHLQHRVIGRHYGKSKIMKSIGLLIRSLQMLSFIVRERPDLAFSHGSRSQLLIATIMGIPTVVASDYEYAKGIPFFRPALSLVPELLIKKLKMQGLKNVTGYPGIKEDVYIHGFDPDPTTVAHLGVNDNKIIVTIRPPATVAHYHSRKSDILFEKIMNYLISKESTQMVMLPRTHEQKIAIENRWPQAFNNGKITVPIKVLYGLSIIWFSDLVISGGGTMIREAAALSVPAFSIFGGKIGAVDQFLEASGRLIVLRSPSDIHSKLILTHRERPDALAHTSNRVLLHIILEIERLLE